MIEILQFIFQDGWHYFGMILLILAIGEAFSGIFRKVIVKQIKDDK